jgi:hypothetical protein
LIHKYEHCIKELRKEWTPKLEEAGVTFVPLDDESFARFLFEHPCYKKGEHVKSVTTDQFDLNMQKKKEE